MITFESMERLTQRLYANPGLLEWSQLFSSLTWNKIGFIYHTKRLRINETSFTQELIYSFWLMAKHSDLPIELYESTNEKADGNDLEIYIQTEKGYLLFPVQCKLIRRNGDYASIRHLVKGRNQIDLLLEYAKKKGGYPLYLLYNFIFSPPTVDAINHKIDFPIDAYGCSIAPARFIKDNFFNKRVRKDGTKYWHTPRFLDLHPDYALPFQTLIEAVQNASINNLILQLRSFEESVEQPLRYYNREELSDKLKWNNLAPPSAIGFIPRAGKKKILKALTSPGQARFNPAFRIIISKERRTTRIVRYIG